MCVWLLSTQRGDLLLFFFFFWLSTGCGISTEPPELWDRPLLLRWPSKGRLRLGVPSAAAQLRPLPCQHPGVPRDAVRCLQWQLSICGLGRGGGKRRWHAAGRGAGRRWGVCGGQGERAGRACLPRDAHDQRGVRSQPAGSWSGDRER